MNINMNLGHKKYLMTVLILLAIMLAGVISLNIKGLYFDTVFGYQALYQHQAGKLEASDDFETIFIGDSSLGSAINAAYFSELSGMKTVNLSLTGNYGFAGSYNMLKKAAKTQSSLRNVVLVQTIDMFGRPVAYDGYLNTMEVFDDFNELDNHEQAMVIKAFVDSVISFDMFKKIARIYHSETRPTFDFTNDFMGQGERRKDLRKYSRREYTYINDDKTRFLEKIRHFCDDNKLNLIYIHGPSLRVIKENSVNYIEAVGQRAKSVGINILPDQIYIEPEHIGDTSDHVFPKFKNLYTEKYYAALHPHLK